MISNQNLVRCAIYTQIGMDESFKDLNEQRSAIESYIKSRESDGWQMIDKNYEDKDFQRPMFHELLTDIKMDLIDCVVFYKADRIFYTSYDFEQIVNYDREQKVRFVSVMESLDTSTPFGKLMLKMALSYREYERELASNILQNPKFKVL